MTNINISNGVTEEIILKILGMHCSACAMNIDGELEDTAGVLSASTHYAKAETKVKFDPDKIDLATIKTIIKKAGYDTQ